ncbi:thiolase family protein [Oceanicola sp. 502str15]|uniref:thiolase family protein n=1 Tax=Oceanicola sp. 502str15 TaxID=2696061 RepID=UPI002095C2BD|nr:thiolase family protein [Oceanicola sp. 502str15]MCO6381746.1 thiolase family protein [Oceanicola sp. 502str15]
MSTETLPKLSTDKRSPNDPVFVGVGEIPSGRYPDRSFIGDLTEVAHRAIKDAGMTRDDIDTILLIPCLHSFADQADLIFSRMVEELGLSRKAKASMMAHSGGSTSDNAVRIASGLIASGHARNVLVLQAERWGSADLTEMVTMLTLNGIPQEWEQPSGITFNAIGAMIHQRYMEVSGSTPEDMASVCVTLRDWANLNPNAMYRDRKLTIEEIIASKMVCDPLHAKECPMLADGGAAFVMTTAENAAKHSDSWVRINASGGCVSHYSLGQEVDAATLGWKVAADRAYTHADWGPEEADFAQIYDSYAAVTTIGLEGLGLVPPGEGARFCRAGHASPGGKLPINTNGGLLSAGHTGVGGGMALLVEGIRQLLHRADAPRQVENARRGIIGGSGGSYMDAQVLLLERIEKGEIQ